MEHIYECRAEEEFRFISHATFHILTAEYPVMSKTTSVYRILGIVLISS